MTQQSETAGSVAPYESSSDLLKNLGLRVRALRREHRVSRRVLSEQSGVSARYLAQLEAGEGNISIALLAKVAGALGADLASLLQENRTLPALQSDDLQITRIVSLLVSADEKTRDQVLGMLEAVAGARASRVCLIGLRGAGKSTLGKLAGDSLGVPFIELNEQIESLAGIPVSEIIALYGADGYRDFEAKALNEVTTQHRSVVLAAAGGVVSNTGTYQKLLSAFHTVWVKASPSEHMQRVLAQGDTRPMAGNPAAMEQLKKLLADRELDYARSMAVIDTEGRKPAQSLDDLLSVLRPLVPEMFTAD